MTPFDEIAEEARLVRCRAAGLPSPAYRAIDMLRRALDEKRPPSRGEMVQAAGLLMLAAELELTGTIAARSSAPD